MTRLRRDLGTLESYATILGIVIGAGIFRVTSDAWVLTGPSVILGYLVLAPAILATSVAYSVFLSTPLGRAPGGEYTHISRTFGGYGVAFVGAWVKMISYIGALAFLSNAFGDYAVRLVGGGSPTAYAIGSLTFFYVVHILGIRFFGHVQVVMMLLLGISLAVLVVPGLFAIQFANYRPFITHGATGFAAALPSLFFAYAGFESLAQTAGEVKESTRRLPKIFLRGIASAMLVYLSMSIVAFGVLPGSELQGSTTPMSEVAARYLPPFGTWLVTLGAIMAITTSLNATMLVPSRLGIVLARDRLAPAWFGAISPRTATPIHGLTCTFLLALLLLVSGKISLALNIAVFALVVLYLIHSVALLALPRANHDLYRSVTVATSRWLQIACGIVSVLSMGTLVALQVALDLRAPAEEFTTIELMLVWCVAGSVVYVISRHLGARDRHDYAAALAADVEI